MSVSRIYPLDGWYMNCSKVVCVNNGGYELELTVGRIYDIQPGERNLFSPIPVINDIGKLFNYDEHRFISLEDWRSDRLDKLGI